MDITIQLADSPIPEQVPPPVGTGIGAWVEFRGLVRGEEDGQPIEGLNYEAYALMAEREMHRILIELARRWPCLAARVVHRLGAVPAGEAAIYVGIAGRHRAEAFALLAEFMDRLKQDVPIWKMREVASPRDAIPAAPGPPPAHSAAEVVALVRELCRPLETERVALAEAAGRVLREAVRALEDQPPFDRSSVDGYAVQLDDSSTVFRVVDEIRAGDWKPRALQPGEAVMIATGGALPGDGLQVVMKEEAQAENGMVTVPRRDHARNIRERGEDARAGQPLVEIGAVLQPGTLGLLASVGCTQPLVTRLPQVLHLATGNEIVPPGQAPSRGQIRDSNSTLVRAFLGQWGIAPEQEGVGEDEANLTAALDRERQETRVADLLLISGGASVGEHDFTRRVLGNAGFTVHVSKTSARPGKPLIVAQRGPTLAFGLPGNPLSHFVCLNLYIRAALAAWAGQRVRSVFQPGVLAAELAAGGHGRETFWPAHWALADGVAWLTPLRWSSSGDLTALAEANALIRVGAGAQRLPRGSHAEFICTEGPR